MCLPFEPCPRSCDVRRGYPTMQEMFAKFDFVSPKFIEEEILKLLTRDDVGPEVEADERSTPKSVINSFIHPNA